MVILKVDEIKKGTYKVTFQESEIYHVTLVGNTFNYDVEEIKNIPRDVLYFVEDWILGDL